MLRGVAVEAVRDAAAAAVAVAAPLPRIFGIPVTRNFRQQLGNPNKNPRGKTENLCPKGQTKIVPVASFCVRP